MSEAKSKKLWGTGLAVVVLIGGVGIYMMNRTTTFEDVKDKASETVEVSKDYLDKQLTNLRDVGFQEKNSYSQKIETKLEMFKERLAAMKERAGEVSQESINEVQAAINSLEELLQEMKDTGEDKWDTFREDASERYEEISQKIKNNMS